MRKNIFGDEEVDYSGVRLWQCCSVERLCKSQMWVTCVI